MAVIGKLSVYLCFLLAILCPKLSYAIDRYQKGSCMWPLVYIHRLTTSTNGLVVHSARNGKDYIVGPEMKKLNTYKLFMENGSVRNVRFLGMNVHADKPDLLSKYHFVDIESGEIFDTPRSLIFSFVEFKGLKKSLKLNDQMRRGMKTNVAKMIDELNQAKVSELTDDISVSVDPSFLKEFKGEKLQDLKSALLTIKSNLERFDESTRNILGLNNVRTPLRIHIVPNGQGTYALNSPIKFNGLEHRVIYLELDPKESNLGFSLSSLYHERTHSLADDLSRGDNLPRSAIDDNAFSEGLADFITAMTLKDPVIGRGDTHYTFGFRNLERLSVRSSADEAIKYLSDTTHYGRLEEHYLSLFYSFPLWRTFTKLYPQKTKVNINNEIGKIFKEIKNQEGLLDEYFKNYFGDQFNTLNEESLAILHLDLFYASLKHFADENHKINPIGKAAMEAYNEAKEKFKLNWFRIEQTANWLGRRKLKLDD